MKNGTPVISFEGGPSETILDGVTGYIIRNDDLDDFARKTILLLKENKLYEKFSTNAREHIKKNFSYDKNVLDLEMILQNILLKARSI
jgi:glycosyltransferase involved in cell wall biosynthesis